MVNETEKWRLLSRANHGSLLGNMPQINEIISIRLIAEVRIEFGSAVFENMIQLGDLLIKSL